jgi:GNAT superfamily N-acetyltransferase
MVEFRIARVSDASTLAAARQKVWDATYRGIYPDEMIDRYDLALFTARDEKRIANPENKVWLVMDGADCVGYLVAGPCGFGKYKDFDFCLNSLYLLPPYQKLGLGRRAFELTVAECRRRGFNKFFCSCSPHNENAMGFYEHMGGVIGAQSLGHANKAEDVVYFEFLLNSEPTGRKTRHL